MSPGWEFPTCPICHTSKYLTEVYTGVTTWEYPGQFNYVQCRHCSLVLQSPRAPQDQIGQYYRSRSYWGGGVTAQDREYHYGPIYQGILGRKSRGSILDIGSGLGLFLSKFKDRGWKVRGTETSQQIAKFSRKKFKLPVVLGDLLKLKIAEQFDVISFIGVFEHVYQPDKTLQKVHRLLKADGLLVIVPPNWDSLGHEIFGRRWYSLDPGRHVFHYSPLTMARILHDNGFAVEEIEHNHGVYNVYSLFINFRYFFSPKYSARGGNTSRKQVTPWVKYIGVGVGYVFAYAVSLVEVLVGRGESMVVYARKKT